MKKSAAVWFEELDQNIAKVRLYTKIKQNIRLKRVMRVRVFFYMLLYVSNCSGRKFWKHSGLKFRPRYSQSGVMQKNIYQTTAKVRLSEES